MILIFILLFICFLIWSLNMMKGNLYNLDNSFYRTIKLNKTKTYIMKLITNLASSKFIVLILLLSFLIFSNKLLVLVLSIHMIINSILIGFIKHIFKRERPNINRLVEEKGYSYISGHTMTATNFYGFIIFLIIISSFILPIKVISIILLSFLILLIGYSRVYLGVHYLSDVIGALLISSSYTLFNVYFIHFILNIV